MAVAKIDPNADAVYGNSVVLTSPLNTYVHDDMSRTIHVPQPTGVRFYRTVNGRYLEEHIVLPASSGDTSSPAANANATVFYGADGPGRHHTIHGIEWSYNGTPSGGYVVVESPSGTPVFGPSYVTSGGPGFFPFENGLVGAENASMLIKLSAGGAGVKGSVTAHGHAIW